jgi:putative spermidine/putrescine transport system permease protein
MGTKKLIDALATNAVKLVTVIAVCYIVLPQVITAIMSFEPTGFVVFPITGFSTKWYVLFANYPSFLSGFQTSILLGLAVAALAAAIGVPCAYTIYRHEFSGREALMSFLLSPLMISGIVIGTGLLSYFSAWHVPQGFHRLVLGHLIITIPYVLRVVTASLIGFDKSLEDAAMSLGASEIQTFRHVTLPVIKTAVIAGMIFAFAVSLDDLTVAVFMSNPRVYTLPVVLWSYLRYALDPLVAATSTVVMVLALTFVIVIDRTVGLEKFSGF